jgi:small acid-soluble spore protein (thioredoxin-like protein)
MNVLLAAKAVFFIYKSVHTAAFYLRKIIPANIKQRSLVMKRRRNKPNPDDRSDNAARIQKNINMTISNMEAADEMIATTSDAKMKNTLAEKNERRRQALDGMRNEMRDESRNNKE